jgi:glycosyltransferase involved in cell wall biosynthesis
VQERLRYLGTFLEHAALAAALRSLPVPAAAPDAPEGRLRAIVLSPHPPSHLGTHVRFTRWVPHLERLGCDLEVLTPSTDAQFDAYKARAAGADTCYHHACMVNQWRNIRRAADADVVVLHRGLFPFSPWQRPTFERLLARLNPRLVYDFYDPIWVQRRGVSEITRSRLSAWMHPADKIEDLIRLARVVTASNESLADFARALHSDVRVVPMLLEPDDYEPRTHEERSPVVLGWLGAANNLPRLLSLAPALRRLAESRDVLVHVVSSVRVEIPGVPVKSFTHPWSPESERADLATLDIGLLPLDEASVDDKGKSPFKLLQYLAAGLAVVATPMAIDFSVLSPGKCFLPARTEDDWVEAMTRLVDDAVLRARLGSAARQAVRDHYSFAGNARSFLDVLTTAAGRPVSPSAPALVGSGAS